MKHVRVRYGEALQTMPYNHYEEEVSHPPNYWQSDPFELSKHNHGIRLRIAHSITKTHAEKVSSQDLKHLTSNASRFFKIWHPCLERRARLKFFYIPETHASSTFWREKFIPIDPIKRFLFTFMVCPPFFIIDLMWPHNSIGRRKLLKI